MNTTSLARQYPALTPRERVPLMLAAVARGDELEEARLANSAPTQLYRSADYSDLLVALYALADSYMIRQLALAARYWQGRRLLDRADSLSEDDPQARENSKCLELLVYQFHVLATAWKEWCAELQIDREVLLRDAPGYDLVCQLGKLAQFTSWTAEEAAACARECFEADRSKTNGRWAVAYPYRNDSVAEEVRVMREFLDARVASSQ